MHKYCSSQSHGSMVPCHRSSKSKLKYLHSIRVKFRFIATCQHICESALDVNFVQISRAIRKKIVQTNAYHSAHEWHASSHCSGCHWSWLSVASLPPGWLLSTLWRPAGGLPRPSAISCNAGLWMQLLHGPGCNGPVHTHGTPAQTPSAAERSRMACCSCSLAIGTEQRPSPSPVAPLWSLPPLSMPTYLQAKTALPPGLWGWGWGATC